MTETKSMPKMLTIRQIAATGILSEHAIRMLVKAGKIPHLKVGNKVLINFDTILKMLEGLSCEG